MYENGSLKLFFQPEGYVMPDGSSGFDYVYNYKDHLGNIRLSYSDINGDGNIDPNTEILDEKNYYPFGLEHKGYNNSITGAENNHKTYQSKELEKELGLDWHDFGARRYQSDIVRWTTLDPMAEKFYSWSPYNAMMNSPTMFVDPTGMAPFTIYENETTGETVEVKDGVDKTIKVNDADFQEAKEFASLGELNNQNKNWNPDKFSSYNSFYEEQSYGSTGGERLANLGNYLLDGLMGQTPQNPYMEIAVIEDYGLLSGGAGATKGYLKGLKWSKKMLRKYPDANIFQKK